MRNLIIVSAALLAASAAAAQATATSPQASQLTQAQAQAKLTEAGYSGVRDLEMDDGFWEADVRTADGRWIDARVHPQSGKVYAEGTTPKLTAEATASALSAAGYTKVRDLDFDAGVWTADAVNKAGVKVDVAIDPNDGAILYERADD